MTEPSRRQGSTTWPNIFDWFDEGLPSLFRPGTTQAIRVEERVDDDRYVLRAELPGIDPQRDVDVSVSEGVLTITAERRQETEEAHRSEFRYGSFTRRVALPSGAREDDVTATYENGILEVAVRIDQAPAAARRIPVQKREG